MIRCILPPMHTLFTVSPTVPITGSAQQAAPWRRILGTLSPRSARGVPIGSPRMLRLILSNHCFGFAHSRLHLSVITPLSPLSLTVFLLCLLCFLKSLEFSTSCSVRSSHGRRYRHALHGAGWAGPAQARQRARPQGRHQRCAHHHAQVRQQVLQQREHLVRRRPTQVLGPLLRRDPLIPQRRVRWRLRLGHRRTVVRPRDVRPQPRAGGHPRPLGHAGSAGVPDARAAGQERGEVRRGRVVQGRGADLQRGGPGLPGQPQPGARAEHPGHLGHAGDPDGRRGGLPCGRRAVGRGDGPHLPGRLVRPLGLGGRPRHVRGAEGEGDQERAPGHVLHVRVLRAGHRDRQGPAGEPQRPLGGPRGQQRLGLRHQLHPRELDPECLLILYRQLTSGSSRRAQFLYNRVFGIVSRNNQ